MTVADELERDQTAARMVPAGLTLRFGGACAALGGVLAIAGNVAHPTVTGLTLEETIVIIADTPFWTEIHFVIGVAIILGFFGLVALALTMPTGRPRLWAWFGGASAGLGTAAGFAWLVVEFTAKVAADNWAGQAPGLEPDLWLAVAFALWSLVGPTFGWFVILYFGVAFVFFGFAIVDSDPYPGWMGWIALAGGAGMIVGGAGIAVVQSPLALTVVLLLALVLSVWFVGIGALMWRRATTIP